MSSSETLELVLLSHTNVGKTTLARTLLRRDVGEVLDRAHVTLEACEYPLLEGAAGERLVLWDTPGFGDSARLERELQALEDPLAWEPPQGDEVRRGALAALRCVADHADVVLYLVSAAESPLDAGYVLPEMRLLERLGRPVLVLLNQTGAPSEVGAAADLERWRAHLERFRCVRAIRSLDAYSRCWVEEGLLIEELGRLLDGERRSLSERLLEAWRRERRQTLHTAMETIATELLRAARDEEAIFEGAWGNDRRQAMEALARRMEEGVAAAADRLIQLQGLDGRGAVELRTALSDFATSEERLAPRRWGVIGGTATGLVTGLGADLASGGLSFGAGMVLGALTGGLGAMGVARAYNTLRGPGEPRVAWTPAVLTRTAEHLLLRYLAVAHFGRGRGAWREREAPAFWRRAVADATASRRVYLEGAWRSARGSASEVAGERDGLTALLSGVAREVLSGFYPDAGHLLG